VHPPRRDAVGELVDDLRVGSPRTPEHVERVVRVIDDVQRRARQPGEDRLEQRQLGECVAGPLQEQHREVDGGEVLGARRKEIILATKYAKPMDDAGKLRGASRRYIVEAVEASLRRLKTDWFDLYQQHEPDPGTPIEETLRALDDLVRAGKVRYVGCSNLPAWQVVEAQWTSREKGLTPFISCQDEYSLVMRDAERELIPAMQRYGLGLLPYFPLASGLLTGKYQRNAAMPQGARLTNTPRLAEGYLTDANWKIVEKLEPFCAERGRSMLELAFSWLLARPTVASVIAGATRPEQLEQNVKAAGWALTPEEMTFVDGVTRKS